ncbi:uncharacterized protein LOC113325164 [Papaver somniferum]|uniref:uncharacterized protein LOC113325164 n=1 Tax=Papaver somniferum TaxID=3469 RepID=UPI000E6FF16D|nr:uncharacterized protein LOC113325164 [Papaver somniferum]
MNGEVSKEGQPDDQYQKGLTENASFEGEGNPFEMHNDVHLTQSGGLNRLLRQTTNNEAKKGNPSDLGNANTTIAAILKSQEAQGERMEKLERRNRRLERRNRKLKRKAKRKAPLAAVEEVPEEENPFEHLQDDERINIPDASNEETTDRFPKGSRGILDHEDSSSEGSSDIDAKHRRDKNQIQEVKTNCEAENLAVPNPKRGDTSRSTHSKIVSYAKKSGDDSRRSRHHYHEPSFSPERALGRKKKAETRRHDDQLQARLNRLEAAYI